MISAGEVLQPAPTPGYGTPSPSYGPPAYGQQGPQNMQVPQPWPTTAPSIAGPNVTLTGQVDPKDIPGILDQQDTMQEVGMGLNAIGSVMNTITTILAMKNQKSIVDKYYDYLDKVADGGMTVALAQARVQEYGIRTAKEIEEIRTSFEEKRARIGERLQIRLAKIAEHGRTERAGIYAADNAFSRQDYPYGIPLGRG